MCSALGASGATQRGSQREGRRHRHQSVDEEQPFDLPVTAEGRSEQQRDQYAEENARRAHGDPCGTLILREILAGELAHRAQHDRLGNRDGRLPGHRPGERLAAQSQEPSKRDQRPAAGQHRAKPAIEQDARRDGQHDIQQRKDLRQPPDGGDGHPVVAGRLGCDRSVGEPQDLRRGAHQPVGDDYRPAASPPHL